MAYVILGIVVLLIVAGFVTFLVMNSMRKGAGREHGGSPGIGPDPTPLGDTSQHAGEQSSEGQTVGDPESAERGLDPAGEEPSQGDRGPSRPERPEDRQLRDSGAGTRSERLADRPR